MASLIEINRKKGIKYAVRYRLELHSPRYSKIYLPFGFTKQDALLAKQDIENRIARHRAGIETFQSPFVEHQDVVTIRDYREWFFRNKKTAKGTGGPPAPRTIETYQRAFRFLVQAVGNINISDVSSRLPDIEDALQEYHPTTRSILIRSLRQAWNFGIQRGRVQDNPFKKIEIATDQQLPEILTIDEKDRIFAELTDPQIIIAFALARYAGLRRSEICKNIKWKDISWDQNIINIPSGKTGENQKVPMVAALKSILMAHKQDEGYLVNYHPDSITHGILKAKKMAGINKKGSIHILRHSLGAELRSQGVDIRDIQDLLRHASISTTQIYTQLSKKALLDKINEKTL